jgi:hypothetical protein
MSDRSVAGLVLIASVIAELYIAFGSGNEPPSAYFIPLPAIILAGSLIYRNENS